MVASNQMFYMHKHMGNCSSGRLNSTGRSACVGHDNEDARQIVRQHMKVRRGHMRLPSRLRSIRFGVDKGRDSAV